MLPSVFFFSCIAKKTAGRALAVWRFITSGEYRDIACRVRPQANRRPSSEKQLAHNGKTQRWNAKSKLLAVCNSLKLALALNITGVKSLEYIARNTVQDKPNFPPVKLVAGRKNLVSNGRFHNGLYFRFLEKLRRKLRTRHTFDRCQALWCFSMLLRNSSTRMEIAKRNELDNTHLISMIFSSAKTHIEITITARPLRVLRAFHDLFFTITKKYAASTRVFKTFKTPLRMTHKIQDTYFPCQYCK